MSPAKTRGDDSTAATETPVEGVAPPANPQETYAEQVNAEQKARDDAAAAQAEEAKKVESDRLAAEAEKGAERDEAAEDALDTIEDLEDGEMSSREKFDAAGFHKKTPAELADIRMKGLSHIDPNDTGRLHGALKTLMESKGIYTRGEKEAAEDWSPAAEHAYQGLARGYDSMPVNLVPQMNDFTVEFLIEFLPVYYGAEPVTPSDPAKLVKARKKKEAHQAKMLYDGLGGVDPEQTHGLTADFDLTDGVESERYAAPDSDDATFVARGTLKKKKKTQSKD